MDVTDPSEERARPGRRPLLALAALSFLVRLGAVAVTLGLSTPPEAGSDEFEYDAYAWNLAQGRGYRGPSPDVEDPNHLTAYRPPSTPLFFAAIYRVAGHHYPAAHVCNAALGAWTVLLVFGIARSCSGVKAAWTAAVAFAAYPFSIYYGLSLNSEVFSAWLVCLFVWCCLRVTGPRGAAWSLGAGLAFGLLLLSKPGFLFAIPLLPVWAYVVCGRRRDLWRRALILPAATALVMAPWVARNWVVMHRFIPFGTGGGQLLLCGNNRFVVGDPNLYGYSVMDSSLPEYAPALHRAGDEVRRDDTAKRFALHWLRENPGKWFYLAQGKFLRLWTPLYVGARFGAFRFAASAYYGLILAAFAASALPVAARLVRERHPGAVMLCLILGTVAVALVFHGQHRYRFPVDSLCAIIAAAGLVRAADTVNRKALRPSLADLVAAAARHRRALALTASAAVGLSAWWAFDRHQIELYRDRECRSRLAAVAHALSSYREQHGRAPASLGDLVPGYLPNLDSLHCPKHSLGWHDYQRMASTDVRGLEGMISYRWEEGPGGFRVAEDRPRHFGRKNVYGSREGVRGAVGREARSGGTAGEMR